MRLLSPLLSIPALIFLTFNSRASIAIKPPPLSSPILVSGSGTTTANVLAKYDFDGDGHPDLVLPDHASGQVLIKLNTDGTGTTFANSASLGFFPGSLDWVAAGNINHSGTAPGGLPDLVVASGGEVTVEANQGLINNKLDFVTYGVLSDPSYYFVRVAVADLDGDGYDDVLVTAQPYDGSDAQLIVYFNLGSGGPGFADPVYYDLGVAYADNIAVGDLDGDKVPDAAVVAQNTTYGFFEIIPFINDGFGDFDSTAYAMPPGLNLNSIQIGNLAGHSDGRADIFSTGAEYARSTSGVTTEEDGVVVMYNRGDDTFLPTDNFLTGFASPATTAQTYGGAALFQYNPGGIATVAVTNQDNGSVSFINMIAEKDGQGMISSLKTTGPYRAYRVAPNCSSVAVADINGDGHPDVVAGLNPTRDSTPPAGNTSAAVLLNNSATMPPAVLSVGAMTDAATGEAFMGDTVTYTLAFANEGDADAHQVTLGSQFPKNSTYVNGSASSTALGSGTVVKLRGIPVGLSWNLGTLPAHTNGSVTFQMRVNTELVVGKTLSGNYGITSDEAVDGGSLPRVAVANSIALMPAPMAVAASTSGTVTSPGDTITYTLNYQNLSSLTVNGATLTCGVPAQTKLANSGGAGFKKNTLTWTLGTLAPQSSGSQTFTVTVNDNVKNGHDITGMETLTALGLTPKTSKSRQTANLPPVENIVQ